MATSWFPDTYAAIFPSKTLIRVLDVRISAGPSMLGDDSQNRFPTPGARGSGGDDESTFEVDPQVLIEDVNNEAQLKGAICRSFVEEKLSNQSDLHQGVYLFLRIRKPVGLFTGNPVLFSGGGKKNPFLPR